MARYCFYCGRELQRGEKCGCRTTPRDQQEKEQTAGQPQQSWTPNKKTQRQKIKPLFWKRFKQRFARFSQKATQQPKRTSATNSRSTSHRPAINRQPKSPYIRQMLGFLTHPADSINKPDHQIAAATSLMLLLVAGLLCGLFLVAASRQPQLQQFVSLNHVSISGGSKVLAQFFIFLQGFGSGLALFLLPALLYHIILRLSFRYHVSIPVLITRMNPAFFYAELFLLGALLVLPGSIFSSLFMLATGLAASTLAQFLVLRRLTSFDENRCFVLVALISLIFTSIVALLANLAMPVLQALLDHSVVI